MEEGCSLWGKKMCSANKFLSRMWKRYFRQKINMKSIRTNQKKELIIPTVKSSKYLFQIVIAFIIISVSSVKAQDISVKGTILTSTGEPLVNATVSLLNARSSALIQTVLTDSKGMYNFTALNNGEYIIGVKAVGFTAKNSLPFLYASTPIVSDTIIVEEAAEVLQEVIIANEKPAIERKEDRMIINVAGSTLAAGNNAVDILERAPGVSIDRDGNISLHGKTGVTVMINEKLTYLSNSQLASMLRSTNGNTIQSIEIMSNPSSKYDAGGSSGIINIKLKKNKKDGVNGNLVVGAGKAHYLSNNSSLALNAKSGNLNAFATLSSIDDKKDIKLSSQRFINDQESNTVYLQNNRISDFALNNSYRIGADYDTGKNNTTGIVINGYFNDNDILNKGTAVINEQPANSTNKQISVSHDNRTMNNIGINLNNRFKLDTLGQSLSIDLDYIKYKNDGNALLNTLSENTQEDEQKLPYYLRQKTPAKIVVNVLKADYVYPDNKLVKMEAGIKISEVKTNNTIEAQTSSDNVNYIFIPELSNNFKYNEKIQAGYLNLNKIFDKTTVQVGLRAEYTNATGTLINSNDAPINQKYLDFFPNIFILQSLNEKRNISINLNRRIERPNYQSLNPFSYFIDPYTRQLGNPFLRPQYANNIGLNYTYNLFNIGLSYSHTTDVSTETVLTDPDTKISSVTFINLNSQDLYTINSNYSYAFTNWWNGNINAYLTYNNYNLDGSPSVNSSNKNVSYNIKSTQNFRINDNVKIEVNGRYQSDFISGLYSLRAFSAIDAGVNYSFWSGRSNMNFSINDIFNSKKTDLELETKGSYFHGYQKYYTRVVRLVFTYNFGSKNMKSINRQSGANDEKARAGN